jgi:Tol biopolymer transport system component
VAFVRIAGEGVADIYEVPLKGGEPRQITFDSKYIGGVTWTADGKDIIFSSHRAGSTSLWRIPGTGGTPQRLPMGSSFCGASGSLSEWQTFGVYAWAISSETSGR